MSEDQRTDAPIAALRARLDEPIERATELTRKTLAWFPIRVWRRFLQRNGFLLAAGISYQALFAILSAIYLAFAITGVWLGASDTAVQVLTRLINAYIPGLISDDGLVQPEQVAEITASASDSFGVLTVTGVVAVVVVVWTAIGFLTYTRRGVRDIFGLPYDARGYVLLKARDLLAALIFGVALIAGSLLGFLATWALQGFLAMIGIEEGATFPALLRGLSFVIACVVNIAALAALFRFLTGTTLPWNMLWPGSVFGGIAMGVLQLGAGLLLFYTPSNPLLATFAVFIGFLLWFRLNGIVILVAAAWLAVAADDRDLPLEIPSASVRARQEYDALLTSARLTLRHALQAHDRAPWWARPRTAAAVRRAEDVLEKVRGAAPEEIAPPARLLD